ncbi:hypothetical protein B0T17DRAFT_544647 [Bombardia bombarda]|uniref:DUF1917-domain-containing protein n=1 Tax=Bombardia bombarda TaxID=252184 RepID=A0AA39T127_9PEZI|nr:hypothetical protein B0T17DRAFT_544647 [Bombardia bombarda]
MDPESDFYGDEETVSKLNARLEELDTSQFWESQTPTQTISTGDNSQKPQKQKQKQSLTMSTTPNPHHSTSSRLHNRYAGQPSAWQLSESVDAFLARLPPSTTDWRPELDWIRIANPFIPAEPVNLPMLHEAGKKRLDMLSGFMEMNFAAASKQSPAFAHKEMIKDREEAVQDLRDLAAACNLVMGKWMLFPEPGAEVDAVWAAVAKATANNELGIAAKVETRDSPTKARLLCVYTKDFRDKVDVARVLNRLRELELVRAGRKPIYYKLEAWTELDIYSGNKWSIGASMYSSTEIFGYIKDITSRRRLQ